jgi:hypothetical protein
MRSVPLLLGFLVVGCGAGGNERATGGSGASTSTGGSATGGSTTGGSGGAGAAVASGGSVTTGGSSSGGTSGGDTGSGGSGASAEGGSGGVPHTVAACDALAGVGEWEEITPPDVKPQLPGPGDCTYGVGSFVVDPNNPAVVILGTCQMGVWKTTDCGANWSRLNTGENGEVLDHGRQWTFEIDPMNPDILYANSGYNHWIEGGDWEGNGINGLFKSTNGGTDWYMIWPPEGDLADKVDYAFVGSVEIDPLDHLHLLLTFHAECNAPYTNACVGESTDGGETWALLNGEDEWVGGEGQGAHFLAGGGSWIWGSQSNGLWLTTDGGDSYDLIDASAVGHGFGGIYRAGDGAFYLGTPQGIKRSTDGTTWTLVPNSGQTIAGLTGDGTTMWASKGFPWNVGNWPDAYQPFWSSPENDGQTWTQYPSPDLLNGGGLAYDSDHNLLYSSNEYAGFWRVVTK